MCLQSDIGDDESEHELGNDAAGTPSRHSNRNADRYDADRADGYRRSGLPRVMTYDHRLS